MTNSGIFFGRNQNVNNGHCLSCVNHRRGTIRTRILSLEPLESRDLLSVAANPLDADAAAYVSPAVLLPTADSLTVDLPSVNEQTVLQSNYATPYGYNNHDYQKIIAFLEQTDESGVKNGKKINSSYNPSDPTTWKGIYWGDGNESRITHILIGSSQLVGDADFSGFTSLQALNCSNNQIASLNLSGCTSLTYVNCTTNKLNNLNVSGCSVLNILYCFENNLSTLTLTNCPELATLNCYSNKLEALDVTSCKKLETLTCSLNKLSSLKVSGCTALKTLNFYNNQLTSVNASGCTSLTSIDDYLNPLTSLDISDCTSLTEFSTIYGSLTTLKASGCTALTTLSCNNNKLTSLDVSNCSSLRVLNCSNNSLPSLKTTGCSSLSEIDCHNNQLSTLEISSRASLTKLNCRNNPLDSLNMSGYASLTELDCSEDNLGTLNVSSLSALTKLNCSSNQLNSLTLTGCTSLSELNCSENDLGTLNISSLTTLTKLNCNSNQLDSLTLTGLSLLTELKCGGNNLEVLDVSKLTALTTLDCRSNQLTSLNLEDCTSLTELIAGFNQLKELNVTKNAALTSLYCGENSLTELNVSNNVNLVYLSCDINSLTKLDVSNNVNLVSLDCAFNSLTELDASRCTELDLLAFYGNPIKNVALPVNRSKTIEICLYTYDQWTIKNSVGTILHSGISWESFDLSTTTDLPLCVESDSGDSILFTNEIILNPENSELSAILINRKLYIPGSPNDDWVEIEENAQNLVVRSYDAQGNNQLNSWSFDVNTVDSILFWGYAGNDVFKNWSHVTNQFASKDVYAYGGDGDDVLIGGSGNDCFLGGEGNDYLDGADGDNRIVTGSGFDTTANTGTGSNLFVWMGSQDSKSWSSGSVLGDDDVLLLALTYSSNTNEEYVRPWTEDDLSSLIDENSDNGVYMFYARCGNWKALALPLNNNISEILCGTCYIYDPENSASYNYGEGVYLDSEGSHAVSHEFGHFWDGHILMGESNPFWEEFYSISWDYNPNTYRYTYKAGCVTNEHSPDFEFTDDYAYTSPYEDWAQCIQAAVHNYNPHVVPVGNGGQKINAKFAVVEKFLNWLSTNSNDFSVPTNLRATGTTPVSITLNWGSVANAPGYTLIYSKSSDFTNCASINVTSNSATVDGLDANTAYYFKVLTRGNDDHTNSSFSQTYSAQTLQPAPLASPTLSASATGFDAVSVTVGSVDHATKYELEYSLNSNFSSSATRDVQAGVTTISGLTPNATYYFRVRAIGTGGYSNSEYTSTSISVILPISASVQNASVSHSPFSAMADSVDRLSDWEACFIELWVPDANRLNSGQTTVTFSYNPDIYNAPSVSSCSDGVSMNLSQRTQLSNGNVQYTITVQVSKTISSQTNNLYLGTISLTPLSDENAGMEDGQDPQPVCSLNGFELSTTVQPMSFDLERDGVIDVNDFIAFATVFGLETENMTPDDSLYHNAVSSDFNKNGIVDIEDFISFATFFGSTKNVTAQSISAPCATEDVENVEWSVEKGCASQQPQDGAAAIESAFEEQIPEPEPAAANVPLLVFENKAESSMTLREVHSAALLDLYDNQQKASDALIASGVLMESRIEAMDDSSDFNESLRTLNEAIDSVLEDDLLAIDWEN